MLKPLNKTEGFWCNLGGIKLWLALKKRRIKR